MRTKRINRVFLLIVCLYLIGSSVIGVFVLPAFTATSEGSVLVAQALILTGTLIGCRMLCVNPVSHMRLHPAGPKVLLCGILSTAALYPFLALVSSLMQMWFKSGTDMITDVLKGGNPLVNLLIFAFIPACVEEMMNRGLLYRAYRQRLGVRRAALLSAFLFGLFHMNLDQFAYTFLFGLFLCLILEASDSLWTCIACHFALNAVSVLAAPLLSQTASAAVLPVGTVSSSVQWTILGAAVIGSGVLCVCFFLLLLRCSGRREVFRETLYAVPETDERIISAELTAAVCICVLCMIAYELIM